jgi:hypothetical protein
LISVTEKKYVTKVVENPINNGNSSNTTVSVSAAEIASEYKPSNLKCANTTEIGKKSAVMIAAEKAHAAVAAIVKPTTTIKQNNANTSVKKTKSTTPSSTVKSRTVKLATNSASKIIGSKEDNLQKDSTIVKEGTTVVNAAKEANVGESATKAGK